jgi:hypothetical protein
MNTASKFLLIFLCSIAFGGCSHKEEKNSSEQLKEDIEIYNRRAEAQIVNLVLQRMEITQGHIARLQAELDLTKGGSLFEIKKAPCGAGVFVDGHLAGTVYGCRKSDRFGQTEVSESDFLVSIPPKQDKKPYVLSLKKPGYKTFATEVLKPGDKRGFVELEAPMDKL